MNSNVMTDASHCGPDATVCNIAPITLTNLLVVCHFASYMSFVLHGACVSLKCDMLNLFCWVCPVLPWMSFYVSVKPIVEVVPPSIASTNKLCCADLRQRCNPNQFQCLTTGRCVEVLARCDGVAQCYDGSDETGCGMFFYFCMHFFLFSFVVQYVHWSFIFPYYVLAWFYFWRFK